MSRELTISTWLLYVGLCVIGDQPFYNYIPIFICVKMGSEFSKLILAPMINSRHKKRTLNTKIYSGLYVFLLYVLYEYQKILVKTQVGAVATTIMTLIVWRITLDSPWLLSTRLQHAMKRGKDSLAATLSGELLQSIRNRRPKKDNKPPLFRAVVGLTHLGQYREAVGEYKAALLFYQMANHNFALLGSHRKVISKTLLTVKILNLCDLYRLYKMLRPAKAKEVHEVITKVLTVFTNETIMRKCLLAGIDHPIWKLNVINSLGEPLLITILKQSAAPVLEAFYRDPVYEDYLYTFQLAKEYFKRDDLKNTGNTLVALLSKLCKERDVRLFFILLDVHIFQQQYLKKEGKFTEGLEQLNSLFPIINKKISSVALIGNEEMLLAISEKITILVRLYMQLILDHFRSSKDLCTYAFEYFQTYKSLSLEIRYKVHQAISQMKEKASDKREREKFEELDKVQTYLTMSWLEDDHNSSAFTIRALNMQEVEYFVISNTPFLPTDMSLPTYTFQEYKDALQISERFFQVVRLGDKFVGWCFDKYSDLNVVDLGAFDDWDTSIDRWRDIVQMRGNPRFETQSVSFIQKHLISPLIEDSDSISKLIISVEDIIGLIPIESFYLNDESRNLIDRFDCVYVDSAKDLIPKYKLDDTIVTDPVVFSCPDFSFNMEKSGETPNDAFSYLPYTKEEGQAVAYTLSAKLYEGIEANVKMLKSISSPEVLHFATHAFSPQTKFPSGKLQKMQEFSDTMLSTGLVFTGINAMNDGFKVDVDTYGNGLFTAIDVLSLDLRDTKIITLSACETGLGVLHSGEGTLGLRRAFKIAGARSIISSLWKAEDQTTKELMIHFYSNIKQGRPVAESLRIAKCKIRESKPSPYYWSLFTTFGL